MTTLDGGLTYTCNSGVYNTLGSNNNVLIFSDAALIAASPSNIGNIFAVKNETQGYGDSNKVSNNLCYVCTV